MSASNDDHWDQNKFFIIVPFLAHDELKGFRLTLWIHYKRQHYIKGGKPFRETLRETARLLDVEHGTVKKHKAWLKANGWITDSSSYIDFSDKWRENYAKYAQEPQKPKQSKSTADPRHKELMKAYQEVLGYPIANGAKEGKAAKNLLSQYPSITVDEIIDCYRWIKSDNFWATKPVSISIIHKNIGEWIAAGKPTKKSAANKGKGSATANTLQRLERMYNDE